MLKKENMYGLLHKPYSVDLYADITKNNVLHKLTYKIDLYKETQDNEITLYGKLLKDVFGDDYHG